MKKPIFIIAEAGVNHNGDLHIAKELVRMAADAGADAVKFQTFKAENVVCREAKKAAYQLQTTNADESQFEMLKKLELTPDMHVELIEYCKEYGIKFLSTPFDLDSIDLLVSYQLDLFKIPSGEITNFPYLKKIGMLCTDVIMSTGMSTLHEIQAAIAVLREHGAKSISIMHCNTEYPTPYQDVNLNAIKYLQEMLAVPIGYSDHTVGIEIPVAAAALGAAVIEKHFTLDKGMEGPDHKASLEPEELKAMVKAIRNVEMALGVQEKVVSNSEKNNRAIVRKSIVAKRDITQGEKLHEDNITTKRPGTGISPMSWNDIIGCTAKRDYKKDEMIER